MVHTINYTGSTLLYNRAQNNDWVGCFNSTIQVVASNRPPCHILLEYFQDEVLWKHIRPSSCKKLRVAYNNKLNEPSRSKLVQVHVNLGGVI